MFLPTDVLELIPLAHENGLLFRVILNLLWSHWQLEISHDGNTYTLEMSKYYKLGPIFFFFLKSESLFAGTTMSLPHEKFHYSEVIIVNFLM